MDEQELARKRGKKGEEHWVRVRVRAKGSIWEGPRNGENRGP